MCPILVTDEQEVKERELRFKEHLKLFILDYDHIWRSVSP